MIEPRDIQIAIPTRGDVRAQTIHEIESWRDRYPALRPVLYGFGGLSACDARNQIRKAFLSSSAKILLMIDADVLPYDGVLGMTLRELDIVAAPVLIVQPNANIPFPVVYRYDDHEDGWWPIDNCFGRTGLIECDAVGFGAVALSRRVVRDVGPFFHNFDEDGLLKQTEDMTFCLRAKQMGFHVWADYDARADHCCIVNLTDLQERNAQAMTEHLK